MKKKDIERQLISACLIMRYGKDHDIELDKYISIMRPIMSNGEIVFQGSVTEIKYVVQYNKDYKIKNCSFPTLGEYLQEVYSEEISIKKANRWLDKERIDYLVGMKDNDINSFFPFVDMFEAKYYMKLIQKLPEEYRQTIRDKTGEACLD